MLENIFAAKMLEKSAKKYPGKYSKLLENEFSSNFSCFKKTLEVITPPNVTLRDGGGL